MNILRASRRILAGAPPTQFDPRPMWASQTRAYHQSLLLVRVFYFVMLGLMLDQSHAWAYWTTRPIIMPLWPVAWMQYTGMKVAVGLIVGVSAVTALAAAVRPDVRWIRVLAAFGIFQFGAFYNSFGVVNHGWHLFLNVCVVFILLPSRRGRHHADEPTLCERQRCLRVMWYAQVAILGAYTLSGFFKFAMACIQLVSGQSSAFSVDGLARHVARRLMQGVEGGPHFIGHWVVEYPWIGWVMLLSAIYLELFSVVVAFRPQLHRTWALALILLHVGIYFVMTIMFSWHTIAMGLMLLCSPFAREASLREIVLSLPVIGDVLRWLPRVGAAPQWTPAARPAT